MNPNQNQINQTFNQPQPSAQPTPSPAANPIVQNRINSNPANPFLQKQQKTYKTWLAVLAGAIIIMGAVSLFMAFYL